MANTPRQSVNMDIRPIPDPTVLTTQQLQREISAAREFVEIRVTGFKDVMETRLDGMDKAIKLLQNQTDRVPTNIDSSIGQLQKLHEEKFRSIETQFLERDTRTEQTGRDSKVAVDTALQAAKESVSEQNKSNALAIAKSEATFTKQIDQIGVLITTMQKALDEKIDDVRTRLVSLESTPKNSSEMLNDFRARIGHLEGNLTKNYDVIGIISSTIAVILSVIAIVFVLYRH